MPSVCRAVYLPAASLFTTTLSAQNGVIQRGPDRGPRPSNWVCPFFLKVLPSQAGSPCVSSGSEGIGHVGSPTDVTDEQWTLVQPLVNVAGKRGRRLGNDIRAVVDGVLYIARTGDQWRCLPPQFGPWARVWPQFRRWSRNGTWSRLLAELHRKARTKLGRAAAVPSMVVIGTHQARGASNGGASSHDRGGPYGATKGAKRAVAVDVTGLPLAAAVLPASTHEDVTTETLLDVLRDHGQAERLELVLVDRGVNARAAKLLSKRAALEIRRAGHDKGRHEFAPLAYAWRVEVAHGHLLRSRRLARSFECTPESASGWLQVACLVAVLDALAPRHPSRVAEPKAPWLVPRRRAVQATAA